MSNQPSIEVEATCHNEYDAGGFKNGERYKIIVSLSENNTSEIIVSHINSDIYPVQYKDVLEFLENWRDIKSLIV